MSLSDQNACPSEEVGEPSEHDLRDCENAVSGAPEPALAPSQAKRPAASLDQGRGNDLCPAKKQAREPFDPRSLSVDEDTLTEVPEEIQTFLQTHFRRCMSATERKALLKQTPRPKSSAVVPPKVDDFFLRVLRQHGGQASRDYNNESLLAKFQGATAMSVSPLVALWKDVLSDRDQTDEDTDWLATASVPVTDVLDVIERTVALIGNAFNLISQTRRDALLSAVHKDLKPYATQDELFSDAKDRLFGEEFRSTLESRVSAEAALSKVAEVFSGRPKPTSATRSSGHWRRQQDFRFTGQSRPSWNNRGFGAARRISSGGVAPIERSSTVLAFSQPAVQPASSDEVLKALRAEHCEQQWSAMIATAPANVSRAELQALPSPTCTLLKAEINFPQPYHVSAVGGRLSEFASNWDIVTDDP